MLTLINFHTFNQKKSKEQHMIKQGIFTAALLAVSISQGMAGTLTNGVWVPVNCGVQPVAPTIAATTIEAYNQSIKDINDWQQKASTFNTCLIQEANTDNALIAKSANDEQAKFQATLEKIKAEAAATSSRLSPPKPAGK
jgi:hypothetical protein